MNTNKTDADYGMEWNNAVEYMRSHPEAFLEKASRSGYICPCCGSGSGSHGTGISETHPGSHRFSCFSTKENPDGCFHGEDVIQIMSRSRGKTAFKDNKYDWMLAVLEASDFYNIHIQGDSPEFRDRLARYAVNPPVTRAFSKRPARTFTKSHSSYEPTEEEKYANERIPLDIEEAQKHRDPTKYLEKKRGLSRSTQEHFHCGFLCDWVSPKIRYRKEKEGKKPITSPRVIIPTGDGSYLARDVRDKKYLSKVAQAYCKMKAGSGGKFNWDIVKTDNGIFVTEGEIDAMSIYEAGQKNALALGSTSNARNFVAWLKENKIKDKTFFVCLDADKPGRVASDALLKSLKESGNLGIDVSGILLEGTKDANESLMKDRTQFVAGLGKQVKMLRTILKRASANSR